MKKIIEILIIILLLTSIASATDLSYINTGDYIVFNMSNGAYINLTGQQNFSEFNFTSTLNISINGSYSTYNSTANITLSNISYLNDILSFTGNASSGILNISSKMLNSNHLYYFFVDNIKNTSVISTLSGVVNFNWSNWSQHDFSIRPDIVAPVLISDSVSPSSTTQGSSVTVTALFNDDTSVASALVNVKVPNGTTTNYSMVCIGVASVTCTKSYTSTNDVGTYYIVFYPQDDSGNVANISSIKSFDINVESVASSGSGGGGGGSSFIPSVSSIYSSAPMVIITNVTTNNSKLFIKNEGNFEQEYVIKWNIKDNTLVLDSGSFSKKLNQSESIESIISYNELKNQGIYLFHTDVEYGIYKSEASATITVYDNATMSYVTEPEQKGYTETFKFILLVIVVLLFVGIIINDTQTKGKKKYHVKMSNNRVYHVKKVIRK